MGVTAAATGQAVAISSDTGADVNQLGNNDAVYENFIYVGSSSVGFVHLSHVVRAGDPVFVQLTGGGDVSVFYEATSVAEE